MGFYSALGSSIGSMLGSVGLSLSDATGGWADFSSSQSKYKYQLSRAVAAEKELSEYMARNAPTWNVAGLRAAGINPILAVNGGNIGDTHSMSASASMPSSSSGAGINVASKLQRETQESAIAANSAMADKTKADEVNILVRSLNDLQDGGSKGIEGIARMGGRSFGEARKDWESLTDGVAQRLGKLLGAKLSTSAKDQRSNDGEVRPAPNSAKSSVSVAPASTVSSASVNVPRRMRRDMDFSKHDGKPRPSRHN